MRDKIEIRQLGLISYAAGLAEQENAIQLVKDGAAGDEESSEPSSDQDRVEFSDLVVDNGMREAWLRDEPIDLTSAEFDLLWLLSSNAGRVLSREEIFTALRGIEYDGQDRSIDVRVSRFLSFFSDLFRANIHIVFFI